MSTENLDRGAKRILLIEDEPTISSLIIRALKKEGYEVVSAEDGEAGIAAIYAEEYDLILLDIMLPVLNGFDILEQLDTDQKIADVAVIVISNSGEPIEVDRLLKLGVQDFLVKANFSPDEVVEKVNAALRNERPHESTDSTASEAGSGVVEHERGRADDSDSEEEKQKVLIVEDEKMLFEMLSRGFTKQGAVPKAATSAEAARTILFEEQDISVIILDILLPDTDGFTFLEELKSDERWKDIPVVIASNLSESDEVERGRALGAAGYFVKAISLPDEICRYALELAEQNGGDGHFTSFNA